MPSLSVATAIPIGIRRILGSNRRDDCRPRTVETAPAADERETDEQYREYCAYGDQGRLPDGRLADSARARLAYGRAARSRL
jgi:hypothetical protein